MEDRLEGGVIEAELLEVGQNRERDRAVPCVLLGLKDRVLVFVDVNGRLLGLDDETGKPAKPEQVIGAAAAQPARVRRFDVLLDDDFGFGWAALLGVPNVPAQSPPEWVNVVLTDRLLPWSPVTSAP